MFPLEPYEIALAFAIALLGGFVKGAVGFALPLIMVSLIGTFADPRVTVAALILPAVASNLIQIRHVGWSEGRAALIEHRRYVAVMAVMVVVSGQFLLSIPVQAMYLILGVPVVVLCLVQLLGLRFRIPPARRRAADWGIGTVAGTLGGLSGTWGPPTVLYLLALETPKARQIAVQGVVYGIGSLALLGGHLRSGVLGTDTAPLSALLVVPAMMGMWAGFVLGDRLDQERFRRVTLAVLTVAGLNLIRKGVMG